MVCLRWNTHVKHLRENRYEPRTADLPPSNLVTNIPRQEFSRDTSRQPTAPSPPNFTTTSVAAGPPYKFAPHTCPPFSTATYMTNRLSQSPTTPVCPPLFPFSTTTDQTNPPPPQTAHLSILLLSPDDGRSTLIDLTKTLTEMSQKSKLDPTDISLDLIDAEVSESVMGEPDLLVLFGPHVVLQGYPPWQLRLTEIFHVQDNVGVGYQVFLRALHRFAKVEMRFGR